MANIGLDHHRFKVWPEESFNPEFSSPFDARVRAIAPVLRLVHCVNSVRADPLFREN